MHKRGTAAVLSMIFLVIFAALSAAFYSMVTSSVKIASNELSSQRALAAAESGLQFMQRQVALVKIANSTTAGADILHAIYSGLTTKLNGSTLGGRAITHDDAFTYLDVPAITAHSGSTQQFTARMEVYGGATRPKLLLMVTGTDTTSSLSRKLAVDLAPFDLSSPVFKYGVASKGRVDLADGKADISGSPAEAGSVMSAYDGASAIYLNGGDITGDVTVVTDPSVAFNDQGGTVAGISVTDSTKAAELAAHVNVIDPPEFPDFTPNAYYSDSLTKVSNDDKGPNYKDICVTANMDFPGNTVITGIMYVKPGVTVTFKGNVTVNGVIVVEDPGTGETSTSTVNFQGVPTFGAHDWSGSVVPQSTRDNLAGYSVLAPTAYLYLTGSSGGNSAKPSFCNTIVCGTLAEYGSGIIDIWDGSLISMHDTTIQGQQGVSCWLDGDGVRIHHSKDYVAPTGGYTHKWFWVMSSQSYKEVQGN